MKIIHTADWHIGQIFYGYDRLPEHAAVFDALCGVVETERPDALLVSGDIFHNPRPSAAAQRLFADTLTRLRRHAPGMKIIVTAGNHDSASMHEVFSAAWRELGVYSIGSAGSDMVANGGKLIVELPGKGFVLAVPYMYGMLENSDFFDSLFAEVGHRNVHSLPVVAMAHAMLAFDTPDESRDYRGADEPVAPANFGSGYDYLALGHVHRPASLSGSDGRIRYSGSVLPVSFDENYVHSVAVVEVEKHGEKPRVRLVELPVSKPVITLPLHGFAPWSAALRELQNFDSPTPSYVRLNVSRDETVPPDASEIIRDICAAKGHSFCVINYPPVNIDDVGDGGPALTVEEFRKMSPGDVARMHAAACHIELTDEMQAMFNEIAANFTNDHENKET